MCARKRDGVSLRVGCACVGRIRARAIEYKRDRCRMSSIIVDWDTFRGISVFGRGVFTNDDYGGRTYAGQCKDGHACGLGVATWSSGHKEYAEHGPDGQYDGRCLVRWADVYTRYWLYERGKEKASAGVNADGSCEYNWNACTPDDPRLLALIAQVAPVEVRPGRPSPPPANRRPLAPKHSSDGSAGSFCPCRRWRPPRPLRCTPHAARRRWCHTPTAATLQSTSTQWRVRATVLRYWSHGRHPSVHTNGPVQAVPLPCHSPAHRRTERWHLGRAV
jgi:hypothetical protein